MTSSRRVKHRNGRSGPGTCCGEQAWQATSDASVRHLQIGGRIITCGLKKVDEIRRLICHGDTTASLPCNVVFFYAKLGF